MKRAYQTLHTEWLLLEHIRERGLPEPERNYKFHPTRKWEFDFAWVGLGVAVEVEGGVYLGKGHTGGKYFTDNCEKYNAATLLGWALLRFTPEHINSEEAIRTILLLMRQKMERNNGV